MKKIIVVSVIFLFGGVIRTSGSSVMKGEDTTCVTPFFDDTRFLTKEDLVCFLEGDSSSVVSYIQPDRYVRVLKAFNRSNNILITQPVLYIKDMKDTVLLLNLDVYMASRGCGDEVYYFRTTLAGYYHVFTYHGIPKILAKGGYVIEPYDENAFDAYYESNGHRQYITLIVPENHKVHDGDSHVLY